MLSCVDHRTKFPWNHTIGFATVAVYHGYVPGAFLPKHPQGRTLGYWLFT